MKYIITEQRLNDIISNYLNGIDWWDWDIGDGEFDSSDGYYGRPSIKYRIHPSYTMPGNNVEVIYLTDEIVTKITELFSISSEQAIKVIIDWFNKKYDKNLTPKDFQWADNDYEDEPDVD